MSKKRTEAYYYSPKCECNHFRDAVPIGNYFILASEYLFNTDISEPPIPDVAVYLADIWKRKVTSVNIIGTPPGFDLADLSEPLFPVIFVSWEDREGLQQLLLHKLVAGIIKNMEEGRIVEIACFGGHGRTGTLLACVLGVVEGKDARGAITTIRKRYCKEAVESLAQVDTIAEFLGNTDDDLLDLVPKIKPPDSLLGGVFNFGGEKKSESSVSRQYGSLRYDS